MQSVHPEVQSYLDQVVTTLTIYLGADLIGVYLHGSLAMGSFDPGRSDIDILAVCDEPLHHERRTVLGEALAAIPTPPSGGDLEFSLVTEAAVRARLAAPSFEVHVNTHEEPFVVDGSDRPGDQDLVIHFAMVRARGRALIGPEPAGALSGTGSRFADPSIPRRHPMGQGRRSGRMGGPRHARTRLDGVPGVERGTLLAIPGERRAGFEGRRRGVARAQGPGSGHPGAARCGLGVPTGRYSQSAGRTDGEQVHGAGRGDAPKRGLLIYGGKRQPSFGLFPDGCAVKHMRG
jgi:predicted nucleotidyltransferase